MSITLIKTPATVELSFNDILFKLSTNNMFESNGIKAILTLNFTAKATPGQTLVFSNDLTFTAAAAPDDSGLQFPTTAATVALFVKDVAATFESNYLLSKNYIITYNSTAIILTSKLVGTLYNLTLTSGYTGLSSSAVAGTNQVVRDFFGVLIQFFWRNNGNSVYNSFEEIYYPSESGLVEYNPKTFLQNRSDAFEYPFANAIIDRSSLLLQYYIKYAECYGVPLSVKKLSSSSVYLALPGKINLKLVQWLESKQIAWINLLKMNKSFLSLRSFDNTATKYQLIKLYYLVTDFDTQSLHLNVDIYKHDGTIVNTTIATLASGVSKLHELNVNLSAINTNLDINYIDIYVKEQKDVTSVNSSKKRFNIDYRHYTHEREFIFRNTFGVYELLKTSGDSATDSSISYEMIDVDIYSGTRNRKQKKQINELETKTTLSTGWFSGSDKLPFYLDFISSDDVFEVIDNILYPIVIDTQKVPLYKDNQSFYNIEFSYIQVLDATPLPLITGSFSFAFSNAFKIV